MSDVRCGQCGMLAQHKLGCSWRGKKLVAEQSALSSAQGEGWVRPSKRQPDVGDRVLCITSCDDHMILDYAGAGDFTDPEDDQVTIAVLWWMPLPAKPKEPRS